MPNSLPSNLSSLRLPAPPALLLEQVRTEIARRAAQTERRRIAENAEAIRLRCRTLAGFIREAWHVLEPGNAYVHGWHIDAICAHLAAVTDGTITRLLINVPPGTMKSLIVSVFWPAWEWGPCGRSSLRYLTTSYSETYAKRDSRRMRDLVTSEWYQRLWPEIELHRAAELSFENTKRGGREGMPFQSLTGGRGDRVIIDDPHSTETAESEAERARTTRIFRESVPTRLIDPAGSAIVVIMQRLNDGDVSGQIMSLRLGYEHLMLPMEFEPARRCKTSIGFVDPRSYDGELLFPERFPKEVVERDKWVMTPYAIAGQYQQSPAPREGGLFKAEWLLPVIAAPDRSSMRFYGGSDYAVTANAGDYTVHGVVGLDSDGNPWLVDVWRKQAASNEWVSSFCDLVRKWHPLGWAEETGQIKSGVGPFLEREMREREAYVAREQFPTRGDKAVRAQSFRGLIATRGLRIPADAPWRAEFENELLRFPAGVHDDQVDCMGLIGQLLDRMVAAPRPRAEDRPSARQDYAPAVTSSDWESDWMAGV